ncbi:LysR substrate-binding domain-containing protein [Piscinibacter sp.]|uniref:LysR substrate-binding domain-containing protein n=1 Tax=Piscinibacter sp. TaxID=1903157 RepID=UPI002BEA3255|nr:LysR substrate-binding domain-containing protein [Albitalea sp.]HUG22747.1 LysR substrate-binding domain-containing protein [Albitalea sp.]
MNLRQLETFVRVAELGSFSKAAMILGIAQPALSRQVRLLETGLHETLLERTGRGVRLTESGQRLFEHAVGILQLVSKARDDVVARRDEPTGRVTIGLPPTLGRRLSLPLVDTFRRQWPRARLAIVEGLSAHLAEWIATARVDLALLYNPQPHTALELTALFEEALCLVGPAPRRRSRSGLAKLPLPLRELPNYPLVVPERTHTIRRLIEAQAALAGIELQIAWEVSSVPTIVDLVVAGYGHAVLSESAVAMSGHADQLLTRPLSEPWVTSTLCLAASSSRRPTPLLRQASTLLATLASNLPRG